MKCSICLEKLESFIKTPCNHSFHLECLKRLISPHCPLCRTDITLFLKNNGINNTSNNYVWRIGYLNRNGFLCDTYFSSSDSDSDFD